MSDFEAKAADLSLKVILGVGAVIAVITYWLAGGVDVKEIPSVSPYASDNCLNVRGLNKLSSSDFEERCEGKSFSATVFPKDCDIDNDCELSVNDPELPGFNDDTLFEADLQRAISYADEKLKVRGVITGRGFMGQIEVDIREQEVVPLLPSELAEREKASKPTIDPAIEASRLYVQERASDNEKMMQYAKANDKELTANSVKVQVDPDSVNGMAEYRYYLKDNSIVSCLRGFSADVFVYECKKHEFN